MKLNTLAPCKKSYDQPRQHIKKQRHYFADRGLSSQNYGFSSSHIWMWELDYKESWAPKNWCFWTVVLEKTLESPLDCKEIQPVNPKGNQSWIFIGSPWCWSWNSQYFGHLMWKTDSFEKTLMLGKMEVRRRRGQQKMRWLDDITDLMDMSLSRSGSWWWTGKTGVLQSMGLQEVGHNWVTELKAREVYIFPWYIEDNFHLSLSAFYASKLKSLLKLFSLLLLPDQSWPSSFSTFDVVTTFLFFEFCFSPFWFPLFFLILNPKRTLQTKLFHLLCSRHSCSYSIFSFVITCLQNSRKSGLPSHHLKKSSPTVQGT